MVRPGGNVWRLPAGPATVAVVAFTDRAGGDLAVRPGPIDAALDRRRRAIVDRPWTWLHQVHGAEVVVVDAPGAHAGADADAAVTTHPGAALAVQVADCAPVALVAEGAVAVAHAGWRGLEAGVLSAAADALRDVAPAPGEVRAVLGPCIHPPCYAFGPGELDRLAGRFGPTVRSRTAEGAPALDLPAAVGVALAEAGVVLVGDAGVCTACSPRHWSHRAAGDGARQAVVAYLEPTP